MKYLLLEKIDDSYVNLFENGIFVRGVEYSALVLSLEVKYKAYLSIDKKTGFVYLEAGFPKTKKDEIVNSLVSLGYSVRFFDKFGNLANEKVGSKKDFKDKKELLEKKKTLIKLE